jgi:hypothetical protein
MSSLEDLVRVAMEGRAARQEVQVVTMRLGTVERRVMEVETWTERAAQMEKRMEHAATVLESAAKQVDRDRANASQRRAEEDTSRKADLAKMQSELMTQITLLLRPPEAPLPAPPAPPVPLPTVPAVPTPRPPTPPPAPTEMETETPTPVPSAALADAPVDPAAQEAAGGAPSAADATAAQEGTVVAFAGATEPTEEPMPDVMTEEQIALQIKADQEESKRLHKLRAIREKELAQAKVNEAAASPEFKERAGAWLSTAQHALDTVEKEMLEHEKVAMKAPEPKKRAYAGADVVSGTKGQARSRSADRAGKKADA